MQVLQSVEINSFAAQWKDLSGSTCDIQYIHWLWILLRDEGELLLKGHTDLIYDVNTKAKE